MKEQKIRTNITDPNKDLPDYEPSEVGSVIGIEVNCNQARFMHIYFEYTIFDTYIFEKYIVQLMLSSVIA